MIIRPAKPGDYPALADLWHESWISIGISNAWDLDREGVRRRFMQEAEDRWEIYLAETDGKPVGFLALVPAENQLDQIFVAPEKKGMGIGSALLDFAQQKLPEWIVLWTSAENARARRFYEQAGFVLMDTQYDAAHRRENCLYVWMSNR
ncbi:MAG: GNAT family N-acetyltransferase [Hyphomonas sp.]|uniref:GNAT family N-acetyltransferase n=1 Tax=Hyphomonas sp. TaxID=87 RepID=UPI00300296C5